MMETTESAVLSAWVQDAREQTRLQTRRECLIEVLSDKYGDLIGLGMIQAINSQGDLGVLRDWSKAAISEPSLDRFLAKMRGESEPESGPNLDLETNKENEFLTESPLINKFVRGARDQARLRTTRESLIQLLEQRFGKHGIPIGDVVQVINAQMDHGRLVAWLDDGVEAPSWDRFLERFWG